jgi:hypothetical protein
VLAKPLQGPSPEPSDAAHRCLDQPTYLGRRHPENETALHSKLMTSGAAKSLTRSARRAIASPPGLLRELGVDLTGDVEDLCPGLREHGDAPHVVEDALQGRGGQVSSLKGFRFET